MSAQPRFGRLITAMVTPFDESGALLLDRMGELADRLISQGSDGLVVNGTTGESPTMDRAERIAMFFEVMDVARGRVPVIANVGDNCTHDSVVFARKVAHMGVDAIMVVTPYYNKPPQEGLYRHFRDIANVVDIPVILYNIPGRCVINIDPETILRLAHDCENIVAVKQANSDLEQSKQILAGAPAGFEVISGDDGMTLPLMEIGGTGVISVLSHICAPQMKQMIHLFLAGELERAHQLESILMPMADALFMTSNPIMVKKAMELVGFNVGGVRLPLVEATDVQTAALKEVYETTLRKLAEAGF